MKDILYINDKFILSSDPMDRGPLMWNGIPCVFTNKARGIGYSDYYLHANILQQLKIYDYVIHNGKKYYWEDGRVIGKYIGKAQAQIDDIIEVKLF